MLEMPYFVQEVPLIHWPGGAKAQQSVPCPQARGAFSQRGIVACSCNRSKPAALRVAQHHLENLDTVFAAAVPRKVGVL